MEWVSPDPQVLERCQQLFSRLGAGNALTLWDGERHWAVRLYILLHLQTVNDGASLLLDRLQWRTPLDDYADSLGQGDGAQLSVPPELDAAKLLVDLAFLQQWDASLFSSVFFASPAQTQQALAAVLLQLAKRFPSGFLRPLVNLPIRRGVQVMRMVAHRGLDVSQAIQDLAHTLQRYPDDTELAELLDSDTQAYQTLIEKGSVTLLAQLLQATSQLPKFSYFAWRCLQAFRGREDFWCIYRARHEGLAGGDDPLLWRETASHLAQEDPATWEQRYQQWAWSPADLAHLLPPLLRLGKDETGWTWTLLHLRELLSSHPELADDVCRRLVKEVRCDNPQNSNTDRRLFSQLWALFAERHPPVLADLIRVGTRLLCMRTVMVAPLTEQLCAFARRHGDLALAALLEPDFIRAVQHERRPDRLQAVEQILHAIGPEYWTLWRSVWTPT